MSLITCFLVFGALAQDPSYIIKTKVFEVPAGTKVTAQNVATLKSAKVLASPIISTLEGTKGSTSITENLTYEIDAKSTGKAELGWKFDVVPTAEKDGKIRLSLRLENSWIKGYHGKLPEIATRFVDTTSVLRTSESVLLPFRTSEDKKTQTYVLVAVERETP